MCCACSIFGNLKLPIATASTTSAMPKPTYGVLTRRRFMQAIGLQRIGRHRSYFLIVFGAALRISNTAEKRRQK